MNWNPTNEGAGNIGWKRIAGRKKGRSRRRNGRRR
jgi:hypothetical protein